MRLSFCHRGITNTGGVRCTICTICTSTFGQKKENVHIVQNRQNKQLPHTNDNIDRVSGNIKFENEKSRCSLTITH